MHHHPIVRAVVQLVENIFENLKMNFDGGSIGDKEIIMSKVGAVVDPRKKRFADELLLTLKLVADMVWQARAWRAPATTA